MKKLKRMLPILIAVFVLGCGLITIGSIMKNEVVLNVGEKIMTIGFPVVMFAVIVVGLIMIMTGRASEGNKTPESNSGESEKEREERELREINTSYGLDNKDKQGDYLIKHSATRYKNSTPKQKIAGWIFFALLIADLILAIVFFYIKKLAGMFVCMGIFAAIIFTSAIYTAIAQKVSMNAKIYTDYKKREILNGTVKSCSLSSAGMVSSSDRYNATTRVSSVVYLVVVTCNGVDYRAYSKTFYETNQEVSIAVVVGHTAKILEDNELEEEETLLR